jgi:hypothetical protein
MTLEEAFSNLEHLPSRYRLLIGRGFGTDDGDLESIGWGAGDIRNIRKLRGQEFVSEIGPKLLEISDNYFAGRPYAATSMLWTSGTLTAIVLGAESAEQVINRFCSALDVLLSSGSNTHPMDRFAHGKVLPLPCPAGHGKG